MSGPLATRLEDIGSGDLRLVGGKALALARLPAQDFKVPRSLVVTSEAYARYSRETGLAERIQLELSRRPLADMRWEEMWDAALRIRNMFLVTPPSDSLAGEIKTAIEREFGNAPVALRSSALAEDSAGASFAGLHDSFINVRGGKEIMDHVLLVWASLWSDRALLYRKELGLDPWDSAMAVLVQELVPGEVSGVVFGRSPDNPEEAVIEAVHGLNQGLVDGSVEPDHYRISRATGYMLGIREARREAWAVLADRGVRLEPLGLELAGKRPLSGTEAARVHTLARMAEGVFGAPQDVEWTMASGELHTLQSRPVTAAGKAGDTRSWHLSLTRSLDNLVKLRARIEDELLPAMDREADELSLTDFASLPDVDLAHEISRRAEARDRWTAVYWDEMIPFAHGARLFGQVYNDAMKPADPFEFTRLLEATEMWSLKRNRRLETMAGAVRNNPELADILRRGEYGKADQAFMQSLSAFMDEYRHVACMAGQCFDERDRIVELLLELAARGGRRGSLGRDSARLRDDFLATFAGEERKRVEDLLDLARASYRLRDDDNIHLGRIGGELIRAGEEAKIRLAERGVDGLDGLSPERLAGLILGREEASGREEEEPETERPLMARQLAGQPAGPGICVGKARVVRRPEDLYSFKAGEILVCDSIDPNMTFVVPLAEGIVERRGGMLVHGAIIAREYGLPCVTGIRDATVLIRDGDTLTVDGYLGVVTIGESYLDPAR